MDIQGFWGLSQIQISQVMDQKWDNIEWEHRKDKWGVGETVNQGILC